MLRVTTQGQNIDKSLSSPYQDNNTNLYKMEEFVITLIVPDLKEDG